MDASLHQYIAPISRKGGFLMYLQAVREIKGLNKIFVGNPKMR
jgi:hypothetical protein